MNLLAKKGKNSFLIPGGSTPILFYNYLSKSINKWDTISFILSDERIVDQKSLNSNYQMIIKNLFDSKMSENNPNFHSRLHSINSQALLKSFNDYYRMISPLKAAFLGIASLTVYATDMHLNMLTTLHYIIL